jgi:hypothetical protein
MFGSVWVFDKPEARCLAIDHQVQGGSFLDQTGKPGPVAESLYMNGWLMAGADKPNGSGVMLGLGSGAGPIALLSCFPGFDLTVVEIDPVVIDMCRKHFHLVGKFEDEGRLRIVCKSSSDYLTESETAESHWDVGFGDAYQGREAWSVEREELSQLVRLCDVVWLNYIGRRKSYEFLNVKSTVRRAGADLTRVWDCQDHLPQTSPRNLILTNSSVPDDVLDAFEPYEAIESEPAGKARASYRRILQHETVLGSTGD